MKKSTEKDVKPKPIIFIIQIILIVLIVLIAFPALPQMGAAKATKTRYFTLDNGLKVYLEVREKIPLVNIGFALDVGSKNETVETNGRVHLLEHLVLLGSTQNYSSSGQVKAISSIGLHINAHTSHDLMTLELSGPSEQIDFILKLGYDKLFNLKFTTEELEKEKKVILEELNQVEDDPEKLGLYLALEALFFGHPYRYRITGTPEVIKNTTVASLNAFYQNYFFPSNCVLAIVGDFSIPMVEKKIKEIFGQRPSPEKAIVNNSESTNSNTGNKSLNSGENNNNSEITTVSPVKEKVEGKREMDITQGHLFLAFNAPGMHHPKRPAMSLLSRILGQGVSPLLYRVLKGKRKLVDRVSTRYIYLKHGGAVVFHLELPPGKIKVAQKTLLKFLKTTDDFKYSTDDYPNGKVMAHRITDYLETAKNGMLYDHRRFMEEGLRLATAYAAHILTASANKENNDEDPIKTLKSTHLRQVAGEYFMGKKYVAISIVPKKK